MRTNWLQIYAGTVALTMLNCSTSIDAPDDTSSYSGSGGVPSASGRGGTGGGSTVGGAGGSIAQTGGTVSTGSGGSSSGGTTGGAAPTGGQGATGGSATGATGGSLSSGGLGSGGKAAGGSSPGGSSSGGRNSGGSASGGKAAGGFNSGGSGAGGRGAGGASSGGSPTGGSSGQGMSGSGSVSTDVDCNATMPTGGSQHSGNSQGGSNNLAWQIWSNQGTGTLTTFSTPAFSAAWNNSGDYLGRLGFEWGNSGKTYDQYGTITAGFAFKKSGSGGGFSYIGIYGWSTNPCIEWYIVDDSFGQMPFNPYNSSQKGTATIDGESYKLFSNGTNGTGGSRCNQSSWTQFWSIRQKARQCVTITISDHFKAWDGAGMKLGNLLEAKILVETGGGSGNVDFAVANLQKTQ